MSITQQDIRDLWVGTTPDIAPPSATENERMLQILNQHRNDHVYDVAQPDTRTSGASRTDR